MWPNPLLSKPADKSTHKSTQCQQRYQILVIYAHCPRISRPLEWPQTLLLSRSTNQRPSLMTSSSLFPSDWSSVIHLAADWPVELRARPVPSQQQQQWPNKLSFFGNFYFY